MLFTGHTVTGQIVEENPLHIEFFSWLTNAFKNVADICLPPLLHCLRIILECHHLMTMWNSADLSNWGFSLIWFRYIELSK